MVIECLKICLPLFNKERYIEITDLIISDIVENYNEYLPFIVNMNSEKIKKIIEKIKNIKNEGQTSKNN